MFNLPNWPHLSNWPNFGGVLPVMLTGYNIQGQGHVQQPQQSLKLQTSTLPQQ